MRFNIKGPYGEGFAFAEVSDQYDGFVYLMVQNRRTGRGPYAVDNRMMLAAQAPRNEKAVGSRRFAWDGRLVRARRRTSGSKAAVSIFNRVVGVARVGTIASGGSLHRRRCRVF